MTGLEQRFSVLAGLALAATIGAFASGTVAASPIVIGSNSAFMWLENRGINDVGTLPGLRLSYGANVLGGSVGTSLRGFYAPQNFTDPAVQCAPLATNRNFCSNALPYSTSNPRLDTPWTLIFSRPGELDVQVNAPSMAGAIATVPFPTQVTISGSGSTPTISWELPSGYTPDGFRVQVYDKSRIRLNGTADVIHAAAVAANATSYTIPNSLSSGLSLSTAGNYSINFQVIETRGHVPFTGPNPQILSRSNSFFAFSPLGDSAPPMVFLPQVGEDPNPNDDRGAPFQFDITDVGPSNPTFIDPFIAIGYDYAVGAGDPNFASVILPDIGDGKFDLSYLLGGVLQNEILQAGAQFFFPIGGVDAFSVRGIETNAGLDPTDSTAFVTGLTFVSQGNFTGTMTPITRFIPDAEIPVPGTLTLMLAALCGIARARRRPHAP